MKKILTTFIVAFLMSTTTHADFFNSNDGEWKMGPFGPYWDESDWPEWTPMYWMEEFMDSWDDDDSSYYGYGNMSPRPYMPYSGGYGMPQGGYPYPPAPYGYQAPNQNATPIVPAKPPASADSNATP